ncbi:MAG: DUF6624 domain-containing protein [Cytophagales bacterium]|nr:DUF6624 domain-containing protein [Cytophagales bacterium]
MKRIPIYVTIILLSMTMTKVVGQKVVVQAPALAKEIKKMRDEDQKMRIKWSGMIKKGKSETVKFKQLTQALIAKDRANTARMREIINQYGWPTYDLVGRGSSNSAWLIVQHADRNPLFQIKCLSLLKEAVDANQADPSNYAYLYDRVQVAKGETQRYATQSSSNNGLYEGNFFPIEDESNVQKRREAMNIEQSIEDYASAMGFSYVIPTEQEAIKRAQSLQNAYQLNLQKAQEATQLKDYEQAATSYLLVTQAFGLVNTEDFVEAARVLSLSKHKEARQGTGFLLKAMVRGWDGFDEVRDHLVFAHLKEISPANWEDFIKTAEEMALDRQ